jgi:Domain of unknown function (DUF4403)
MNAEVDSGRAGILSFETPRIDRKVERPRTRKTIVRFPCTLIAGVVAILVAGCSGLDLSTMGHSQWQQSGHVGQQAGLVGKKIRSIDVTLKTVIPTDGRAESGRVVLRKDGKIVAGAKYKVFGSATLRINLVKEIAIDGLRGFALEVRRNVSPLNLLFGKHVWQFSVLAAATNTNRTRITLCSQTQVRLGGYRNWYTIPVTHPLIALAPTVPRASRLTVNDLPTSSTAESVMYMPVRFPINLPTLEQAIPHLFQGDVRLPIGGTPRYEVWRRPLDARLERDALKLDLHLYYYLDGGNDYQCGWDDEWPLESDFPIKTRFSWQPNWNLTPSTRIENPTHLHDCNLTVANFPATDTIRSRVQGVVQDYLTKMDGALAERLNFRGKADELWHAFQEPIELDSGEWLVVRPDIVSASQVTSDGNTLSTQFAISVKNTLVFGSKPVPSQIELPDLRSSELSNNVSSNANFEVVGRINLIYSDINAILGSSKTNLIGRSFEVQDKSAHITAIETYGTSNNQLAIKIKVTGTEFTGWLCLVGKFTYDESDRAFKLADLDYESDTQSELKTYAEWLRGIGFVEQLKKTFSLPLAPDLDKAADKLTKKLNRKVGKAGTMVGKIDKVDVQRVTFTKDLIAIDTVARGDVALTLSSSVDPVILPAQPSPDERGWFVHVDPQEADRIYLMVGIGGVEESRISWQEWKRGDPTEFPVPIEFLHVRKLWMKVVPRGKNGGQPNSYVRFGFNDHVVQNMPCKDEREEERRRDERDKW